MAQPPSAERERPEWVNCGGVSFPSGHTKLKREQRKRPLSTVLTSASIANVGPLATKTRVSQCLVHNEGVHESLGRVSKGSRQATDDFESE